MKKMIELEHATAQLTEDIKDVLHATHINFQALIVEAAQLHSTLPSEFAYLHSLLISLQKLIEERSTLHMGYLITRQIQQEEERVRRERLADYQQKIYDQRRIISDKEGFFQSLLRPKKKRLPTQTTDEFQQMRARQKDAEERLKMEILLKELSNIQALKRLIEGQERDSSLYRKEKNCSISNVNSTAMSVNENGQFPTEKIVAINQGNYTHNRTNSLQHSIVRQTAKADDNSKPQEANIGALIDEIYYLKGDNEELHNIYDQQCLALKFKKGQCSKMLAQYQSISKQLVETRQKMVKTKKDENWRYERCSRPIKPTRRAASGGKD